jgi:hypothetical protein
MCQTRFFGCIKAQFYLNSAKVTNLISSREEEDEKMEGGIMNNE